MQHGEQLRRGQQVKMEHTTSPGVARKIALDHPQEDPLHYDKLALMEVGALNEAVGENPSTSAGATLYALLSVVGGVAGTYHGYRRNSPGQHPIAWALWWGFWGGVVPFIVLPISIAQGFGEPADGRLYRRL